MTGSAFALILPLAFLFMFYRAVESEWPESYSVLSTNSSLWSSRSLGHYLGFRLAPVLAVTLFATVAAHRADRNSLLVAVGVPILHWAFTSGSRIARDLRRATRPNNFAPSVVVACLLFVSYVIVGILAWLFRVRAGLLVPEVAEIVTGLWTALASGIVAVFLTDRRISGSPDAYAVISNAVADVAPEHKDWCEKYAKASGTTPALLETVLVVESLSRPRWFRSLEALSARVLRRSGTYGLMQVRSDSIISDEESVEIAAREYFAGIEVPINEFGHADHEELRQIFANYNADDDYIGTCIDVFEQLWDPSE